jgi:hypothetical protein
LYSKPFDSLDAAVEIARKYGVSSHERLNIIDEFGAIVWECWIDRRFKVHSGYHPTPEKSELHA